MVCFSPRVENLFVFLTLLASCQVIALYCPSSSLHDCGFAGITQKQCESKDCCWKEQNSSDLPWCFSKTSRENYYVIDNVVNGDHGIVLDLSLNEKMVETGIFGVDIPNLKVVTTFDQNNQLRVRIVDADQERWEIPKEWMGDAANFRSKLKRSIDVRFSHSAIGNPFWFAVERIGTGESLFNTSIGSGDSSLVYENQYLSLTTSLPRGHFLYGLGERENSLRLQPSNYTLFNFDIGLPHHKNLYGSHPVYYDIRKGGFTHAVFLRNSNGMEIQLTEDSLKYNVIGGILDFQFVVGDTFAQVQERYLDIIGHPAMPPFWGLGYHQCRWGYKSIDDVKSVKENFDKYELPLETVWMDIDYMSHWFDFTVDEDKFNRKTIREFIDQLHSENRQMVTIVDPGIPNVDGYSTYDEGKKADVFIKDNSGDKELLGKVWPGLVYYPDFTKENETTIWWEAQIAKFHKDVPVDGLWIDMNEPSNFCDGSCTEGKTFETVTRHGYDFNANRPPFLINNMDEHAPLFTKTIYMDSQQHRGLHYDLHNLYGHMEAKATRIALKNLMPNKRPFIITRSTFPGTGRFASKWTGDNFASFEHLKQSITDIINMNLYGIPFIGADICGFNGNTTEELCARWSTLGSFYPFTRNHNTIEGNSQEPYLWQSVADNLKTHMNIKGSLSFYYYTLLFQASQSASAVFRPLFYDFTQDSKTYDIDEQFMIGSCLLVSPVVAAGVTKIQAYFPDASIWYDFHTHEALPPAPSLKTLDIPLSSIGLHLRGGCIVPMQKPERRLVETKLNAFDLLITLDAQQHAKGELFIDNGETDKDTLYLKYSFDEGCLTTIVESITGHYPAGVTKTYGKIDIIGMKMPINSADNIQQEKSMMTENVAFVNGQETTDFKFDPRRQVFSLQLDQFESRHREVSEPLNICIGQREKNAQKNSKQPLASDPNSNSSLSSCLFYAGYIYQYLILHLTVNWQLLVGLFIIMNVFSLLILITKYRKPPQLQQQQKQKSSYKDLYFQNL